VSSQATCAACGRTILDGERVHSYVSAEGGHEVCALCVGRATELGWLPADEEGAEERLRAEAAPRTGFFARLFARPARGDGSPEAPTAAESPADLPPPEAVQAPPPDPAGRGMRPRRLPPDLPPANRFERAIARFNAGEAGRTVVGLSRTLGAPSVSVGDSAGAADEVRVTVAWELTWYQWGVDLGDELRPVYELAKGFEVGEIDAAARQWNASAHDGRIMMVAPPRREAAEGRPVHH